MTADQNGPEPVDLHVGAMLRLRRKALGMNQESLAGAMDVTAQQIQKYETAASRISASKLFLAARALNVRVSYFFAEIDDRETGVHFLGLGEQVTSFLNSPEGLELASIFPQIADATVRLQFVGLARAMAGTGRV